MKDFPDYTVSRRGVVKKKSYDVRTYIANGSVMVHLNQGRKHCFKTIHNLVWETFVGPIPKGKTIEHYDGDRFNCALENLYIRDRHAGGRSNRMVDPKMQRITRLDSEGAIALWNAIVDRAVIDAVKEIGQLKADAVWFLQSGVCEYLDVNPDVAYEAARQRIREFNGSRRRRQSSLQRENVPDHKKRCRHCAYRLMISHDTTGKGSGRDVVCGYMYKTGKRRGCPGANCTKFEAIHEKQR